MEQQLKKAEAAERRRIQNEKAARESEVCFGFCFGFSSSLLLTMIFSNGVMMSYV